MPDLFGTSADKFDPLEPAPVDAPLADRMRPTTLDEYVGQQHLVGAGKILSKVVLGEHHQSLILWGPPGTGKTTLARLIASASGMRFVPYSAVLSGIKEIRVVMGEAEREFRSSGNRTLLFVDEIHRFNKAQQDAFLPFVEKGDVLLIGATTENPSFEVIGALLSRCRALLLKPLQPDEMIVLLERALQDERGLGGRLEIERTALQRIAAASDGDARRALTLLETIAMLAPAGSVVDAAIVSEAIQRKTVHYDKSGEEHFNLVSALHKSIRNSDENATLYWIARIMQGGEDGNYIARRLIRIASEDVGLADPFALRIALDAGEAFQRLGYPEGKLALAQAAVYLARARKSNALYTALDKAEADVERSSAEPVPMHLRNATTALMREAGYGDGYRYAHDDPDATEQMECLPPSLRARRYFKPSSKGRNPQES